MEWELLSWFIVDDTYNYLRSNLGYTIEMRGGRVVSSRGNGRTKLRHEYHRMFWRRGVRHDWRFERYMPHRLTVRGMVVFSVINWCWIVPL